MAPLQWRRFADESPADRSTGGAPIGCGEGVLGQRPLVWAGLATLRRIGCIGEEEEDPMATPQVIALGEALAEFMRPVVGIPLDQPGPFEGPFPSGAPANFADACARLGLSTGFIGTVGDDAFGRMFRTRLTRDGADLSQLVVDPVRTTGTAFVTYQTDGGREFLFHIKHAAAGQAPAIDPAYFAAARLVHITGSTLASGPAWHAACVRAVTLAREVGALVTFDPNLRPELLGGSSVEEVCAPILARTDVVLPSGPELATVTGLAERDTAVQALFARGVRMVILKEGMGGSTLHTATGATHVETKPREERDPTGAGDAFAAGIAYGLLHNLDPVTMLRLANFVGGLAVTKLGPMEGTPTLADARAAL
jgi:sugar/nucleoside kinase (ribokinase family)